MSLAGRLAAPALFAVLAACTDPGSGVIDDSLDGAGTAGPSMCGDGVVDGVEECDDENDDPRDQCTNECTTPACGDGVVQGDEQCDDGDDDDDDACTSSCTNGPEAVASIAAGDSHTCAVSTAGTVRCWGAPDYGRLGQPGYDDYIGDDEPPSDWDPVDAGPDIVAIAAGASHSCVLRSTGTVACWGYNNYGQLGLGHSMSVGDDESPAEAGDLPLTDVVDIALGDSHSCAIDGDGGLRCWGSNNSGQLGTGDTTSLGAYETIETIAAIDLPGAVVEVAAGYEHTCARLEDGSLWCWGRNAEGQLGLGIPDPIGDDEAPTSAGPVPLGGKAIDVATRYNHTCAVLEGGGVRCWGNNGDGQLGYGDTKNVGDRKTPEEIGDVMLEDAAIAIETGDSFTCAVLGSGAVRCWGSAEGLGLPGSDYYEPLPQPPSHVGAPVRELASGASHQCAILDSSAVRCWGSDTGSVLGYPETDGSTYDAAMLGDVDVF